MATIKTTRTLLGTRYAVIDANGHKIKSHRSPEAAGWHCFALNSLPYAAAATRNANDAQWAGRC